MSNTKGWNRKGIRRFNKLVEGVQRNRSTETSKEMEMKLKDHYMDMCGNKDSPSDAEDDDSDDNESDLEELEAYDGFAGTVEVTPVIDVTQSHKRQLRDKDAVTVEETPVVDVTQSQKRQRTDHDSFVSATDLVNAARCIIQV